MSRFKSIHEWEPAMQPPDSYWGDDREPRRYEDWIDDPKNKHLIKFSMVVSDYKEVAVLKGKDGIVYAIYFDDDIKPYRYRLDYGNEYEEDIQYEDVDDDAIIALASDTEDELYGVGFKDWGDKPIVSIDEDLIKELVNVFKLDEDKIRKAIDPRKQSFAKTYQTSKKFNI